MRAKYVRGDLAARFWAKVQKTPGCWFWTAGRVGATRRQSYGKIGLKTGGVQRAHRVSWELHFGAIPPGMGVLHRCDTPSCVRPDHLFLGTDQDNKDDQARKGRAAVKLTPEAVREIRGLRGRLTTTAIASRFGVTRRTVQKILLGISWVHVQEGAEP